MRFAQERGDDGGDQQHHEPGRKDDQAGGERNQAQGILADVQDRRQEPDAAGRLAAGALQLVVEDGIFKRGQIQLGGVFDEAHADAVGEAVAKQTVRQGVRPSQQIAENRQSQFQGDQFPEVCGVAVSALNPGHHAVQDELRDPKHG